MAVEFAALPATGYQLILINDDDGASVDTRLSNPQIVLGFIVTKQEGYFSIRPITPFGVHAAWQFPYYALISPEGKIYFTGMGDDLTFGSIADLKQYLRREAAELYRETAAEARKDGNLKDAASFARCAKMHRREFDENA